jgi:hypothetical protein
MSTYSPAMETADAIFPFRAPPAAVLRRGSDISRRESGTSVNSQEILSGRNTPVDDDSGGSVSSKTGKRIPRRKNLESNRKAASKCRQKKKEKTEDMKREVGEMRRDNVRLEVLIGDLADEIAQIKVCCFLRF